MATDHPVSSAFPPPTPLTPLPSPTPASLPPPTIDTPDAALEIPTEALVAAIEIAERDGRDDLASELRQHEEQLRRTGVTIAVVGEFKKGKSSLVNALVNGEVCPSDPADATVVPIVVAHGDELAVALERTGRPAEQIELAQVPAFGSESGNEANRLGVTRIEIALPRRLLASGLVVIDTPGVGGLESAAGALNLASLEAVDGVLFVTDCSQELTASELAFLAAARARCPAIVCVMSKLDLHLAAQVLADHNRRHLAAAGLDDVEVVTVSSVLHLLALAQGDAQLEQESGFAALFAAIGRTIWEPGRRRVLADAGHELADLAEHMAIPLDAARRAEASEQAAERTITRLTEARERVRQFRTGAARWQRRLADDISELAVEADRDLRSRLRSLSQAVHLHVDAHDPGDDLVFEAWLHKLVVEGVVAHYRLIADRANAMADEIGQQFATMDRQSAFQVDAAAPTDLLAAVHLNREQQLLTDGVARRLASPGHGRHHGRHNGGPVLFTSVVGVVSALPWVPLLGLPFAGSAARRPFNDQRDLRRSALGTELERLATRYLDEIGSIVHEDARTTIGRIERDVHAHYAVRAEQLERTLQHAMVAAEQARPRPGVAPPPVDHHDRATILEVASVAHRLVAGAAIAS